MGADTGLYDYRARWYDPAVGRFVNEDPSGFDGGDVNLYRYCNNSPVINVDPYGLCSKDLFNFDDLVGGSLSNDYLLDDYMLSLDSNSCLEPFSNLSYSQQQALDKAIYNKEKQWVSEVQYTVDEAIIEAGFWQSMFGKAGENVDQTKRYIETEKLGTIDLQHVVSAAAGPPGASTIGGLIVETNQWAHGLDSAFKKEDIISNVVGGVAWREADKKGISVGQQVSIIIENAKPQGAPHGRND